MVTKDDLRVVYVGDEYFSLANSFYVENITTGYRYSKEPTTVDEAIRQLDHICPSELKVGDEVTYCGDKCWVSYEFQGEYYLVDQLTKRIVLSTSSMKDLRVAID